MRHARRSDVVRLGLAVLAATGVIAATLTVPSYGDRISTARGADSFKRQYVAASKTTSAAAQGQRVVYLPDGTHIHLGGSTDAPGTPPHNDNDPRTKNAISRSAPTTDAETLDPTTPAQAAADERSAAHQRAEVEPRLRHVPVDPPRTTVPANRYAMYNGCYAVQSTRTGRWLTGLGTPRFAAAARGGATPLYFKATDLGHYLLSSPRHTYLSGSGSTLGYAADPTAAGNWTVTGPRSGGFRFTLPGHGSLRDAGTATLAGSPTPVRLHLTSGCTSFPEVQTNVVGRPIAGITPYQEVRGFIDAHMHGMAFEFLGGDVHCGRPWSPYGVTVALKDCPDHYLTNGYGAVMEDFLSGGTHHDPVGWPTFHDWPAPGSLTHEGTYYKWIERSWRAGQRIMVNLLVENDQLCKLYPLKRNSCDDMDSIRLQAKDMHLLERYVDAQHGGPGRGWYRIVTNPDQARRVINAGKLAVVMGIETSVPFGCTMKLDVPQCDRTQIDRQLTEVRKMGVSQMELVNKFDNALSGVAGDEGTTGNLVNTANFLETGSFWKMQHCAVQDPEVHDKDQNTAAPSGLPAQDALFGAVAKVSGVSPLGLPVYPPIHHCNARGLTSLGDFTIAGLAKRHMLFDPDHMSVKARKSALDLIERMGYQGVLSSHSWSTPDAYPRIYRDGGFVAPYAGDSTGFVAKWRRHLTWANPRTYWGIGYGADINGLGAQGDPRPGAATHHPVTYPFTTLGGVKVYRNVSGKRVYDINKDGVAHYGLYPDWIQDLRMQAGPAIVKDLARGPEAYLQTWERAYGVQRNACSNPGLRRPVSFFTRLRHGLTPWQTLRRAGQPDRRLGQAFTYCTTGAKVRVTFTRAGHLRSVSRL